MYKRQLYAQLSKWCQAGDISFKKIRTVNLDEYVGLPVEHYESYRSFMNRNLFNNVDIDPANTRLPNGLAEDIDKECAEYEAYIDSMGGVDLQLLGIGHNGHIGFNEPSDAFDKDTHCVTLTQRTIQANSRFFDSADQVPKKAISMGNKPIMQAKKIVMVVNGAEKAQILYDAFFGPITPKVPASILQLHPDVTVFADAEAFQVIDQKKGCCCCK